MNTLTVGLAERSYPIHISSSILETAGDLVKSKILSDSLLLVTNSTVASLYLDIVRESLLKSGFQTFVHILPDGEEFKNESSLFSIYDAAVEHSLDRKSAFIALGGGVVGDITGYAAATYLRGIGFAQIPTTLLAQVDSSVGGKTGINHKSGKNLIGAFYQPSIVISDSSTLLTLSERDYSSGLAEVVKYGAVLDVEFFKWLENNSESIMNREFSAIEHIVKRCCEIKAHVVEVDERESGLRAVLNFGHTIGHVIENLSGYGTFTHGEAVAIGMIQASIISELFGFASPADTARLTSLLFKFNLPVDLPIYSKNDFQNALIHDKKADSKGVKFVLNKSIGAYTFYQIDRQNDVSSLLGINC